MPQIGGKGSAGRTWRSKHVLWSFALAISETQEKDRVTRQEPQITTSPYEIKDEDDQYRARWRILFV